MPLPRHDDTALSLVVYERESAGVQAHSSEAHPPVQQQTGDGEDRELDEADALELLNAVLSRKLREFVK